MSDQGDEWMWTGDGPYGIQEDLGPHTGKAIDARRFETFEVDPIHIGPRFWRGRAKTTPLSEMEEAELKWRLYFDIR